jgi:hypothetical protein
MNKYLKANLKITSQIKPHYCLRWKILVLVSYNLFYITCLDDSNFSCYKNYRLFFHQTMPVSAVVGKQNILDEIMNSSSDKSNC